MCPPKGTRPTGGNGKKREHDKKDKRKYEWNKNLFFQLGLNLGNQKVKGRRNLERKDKKKII
jgi:hypothetical protein